MFRAKNIGGYEEPIIFVGWSLCDRFLSSVEGPKERKRCRYSLSFEL